MILKFLLVGLIKAQSNIECYKCEYVWEVYDGKTQPISGESKCRDGPLDSLATEIKPVTGSKGSYNVSL